MHVLVRADSMYQPWLCRLCLQDLGNSLVGCRAVRWVQMTYTLHGRVWKQSLRVSLEACFNNYLWKHRRCQVCRAGTYADLEQCVTCQAGTYNDATSANCKPCPLNTYMEDEGQTACTSCPAFTSTAGTTSAQSLASCVCNAGYFGQAQICSPCPLGTYSDQPGASSCKQCAPFSNTTARGNSKQDQCLCVAGAALCEHLLLASRHLLESCWFKVMLVCLHACAADSWPDV